MVILGLAFAQIASVARLSEPDPADAAGLGEMELVPDPSSYGRFVACAR